MLLSDIEKGYVTGLLDGEGLITINKIVKHYTWKNQPDKKSIHIQYKLHVRIGNTHYGMLEWLLEHIGGVIYGHGVTGNRKPSWIWHLESVRAKPFLQLVQPHVIVKREQVDLALKFLDIQRTADNDTKEQFYLEFGRLNRRGPIPTSH